MLIESPAGSSEPAAPPGLAARIENIVASLTLFGIMLLPLAEIGSRRFLHAAQLLRRRDLDRNEGLGTDIPAIYIAKGHQREADLVAVAGRRLD